MLDQVRDIVALLSSHVPLSVFPRKKKRDKPQIDAPRSFPEIFRSKLVKTRQQCGCNANHGLGNSVDRQASEAAVSVDSR